MNGGHPPIWLIVAVVLLAGWVLVRRFRRLVGSQPLGGGDRRRLTRQIVLLSVLGAVATVLALLHPSAAQPVPLTLLALVVGVGVGCGLAFYALRHTHFDWDALGEAVRYVPNVWIGGTLFALFVLRFLFRVEPALMSTDHHFSPLASLGSASPLTLGLFLLFASYRAIYAALVLRQTGPAADPQLSS